MKTLIISYYQINKDLITAKYCENKDKPLLKCEGKCYLEKKLKSDSDQQKSVPDFSFNCEYLCSSIDIDFTPDFSIENNKYSVLFIGKYSDPLLSLLQPPKISA